jgi:hypothetical protein
VAERLVERLVLSFDHPLLTQDGAAVGVDDQVWVLSTLGPPFLRSIPPRGPLSRESR